MQTTPPVEPSIDSQMLSTLELLHYCRRFQNTLFAFCFDRSEFCEAVLTDLRVLHAAGIRQVLFCAADAVLAKTVKRWNRSGDRFVIVDANAEDLQTAAFIGRLQTMIAAGDLPLVAFKGSPADEAGQLALARSTLHCAVALGAKKVFFPSAFRGLEINGKFRSYPPIQEARDALLQKLPINMSSERLKFFLDNQELHRVDIVLVQARRGAIYEEVFTHSGSGTLFTGEYPNILRAATESDVRDIMAIMQPYIDEGSLKPVSEEELLELIRSFMVYAVNGQIVASAALIDYGDSYELGKLCTLPRYQARGRARELVRALLERAKREGKRSVFALTVVEPVADFFERLGFKPIEREKLPLSWQAGYDFSRPSRALEFTL
jgi:amino-acid N-acetyltransferase